MDTAQWRAAVRRLNDQFRQYGPGRGTFVITPSVRAQGAAFVRAALAAVRTFDSFTKDNDPSGVHDFGAFTLEGRRLVFKIDCYDLMQLVHSPNAADPEQTKRVLTLMLASEY